MKKYLIYAGMFLGSFLVINVAMYFLLDMTQPETATESHIAADSSNGNHDSTNTVSPEMVQEHSTDSASQLEIEDKHQELSSKSHEDEHAEPTELEYAHDSSTALEPEDPRIEAEQLATEQFAEMESDTQGEIVPAIQEGDPRELAKLAKVLEGMKSDEAAAIASRLTTEEIVSLVMRMKDRKAAKMMAALPVDKAARVAARMSEIVASGGIQS